ncbi:MAG: hypothetical protein ACE5MM_05220 [Nitrospiraceae bacterium]
MTSDQSCPTYYVTIKASGSILDPELELVAPTFGGEPIAVANETRLDLFDGQIVLLFSGSRLVVFVPEPRDKFPYYPFIYFLMYRSRVHYNIISPDWQSFPEAIAATSEVVFSLERLIQRSREEVLDGVSRRVTWQEAVPYQLAMTARELEDLMTLCTPQLYLALAYFLIGCENRRYFLVEYFKAVEAIEGAFQGESGLLETLASHGVVAADYKRLKRYANDQQQPFDIGRHAPNGMAELRTIDVRRLVEEPLSRQVFQDSIRAVRQAIDGYFAYLIATRNAANRAG